MELQKLGDLPKEVLTKMLQDISARELIKYLERSPFTQFRIGKQADGHYIVHPIGHDGETIDLNWIITDEIREQKCIYKHGGKRPGAGRPKLKDSEKKEETIVMRVPKRLKEKIEKLKTSKR